jgi:hypothetical protein
VCDGCKNCDPDKRERGVAMDNQEHEMDQDCDVIMKNQDEIAKEDLFINNSAIHNKVESPE